MAQSNISEFGTGTATTFTATTASAVCLVENPLRKPGTTIQNTSATANVYLNVNGAAVVARGIWIGPGAGFEFDANAFTRSPIQCIADTGTAALSIHEAT